MNDRIFYDSVDPTRIPRNAEGVCGYVDGRYRWSDAGWNLFPNAVKARIAVFSTTNDGHVLDVEPGNATPAQSVDWVLLRRSMGIDPSVYMNTSTWPEVRSAFRARRIMEPHYWVAQYDNVRIIPPGAVAKQFYNNDALGYDMSVVSGFWPGIDKPPVPRPVNTSPAWVGADFVYNPNRAIQYDVRVQVWQRQMRHRGWNIQEDGFYGPKSQQICLDFQKDSTAHGWPLTEDGIVGQHTWEATWDRPISN